MHRNDVTHELKWMYILFWKKRYRITCIFLLLFH